MNVGIDRVLVGCRGQVHELCVVRVAREHAGGDGGLRFALRRGGIDVREMDGQAQPQGVGELAPLGHVAAVHDVAAREADGPGIDIDLLTGLCQIGEQRRVDCLLRVVFRRQERAPLECLRIRNVAHGVCHDAEDVRLHDPPDGLPVGHARGYALVDHPLKVLEATVVKVPPAIHARPDDVLVLVAVLDLRIVLHPQSAPADVQVVIGTIDPVDHGLDRVRQNGGRLHVGGAVRVPVDGRQIGARRTRDHCGEDAQDLVSHDGLLSQAATAARTG